MKRKKNTLFLTLFFLFSFSLNVFATTPGPDLVGKSAISFDLDTNEIIYTKNIDDKAFPASITKMMTGLLLAENKTKNDELTYTAGSKKQPTYSYNLNLHPVKVGDLITADDAMKALLLYSGNDIAYMIGDNVAGNSNDFAKMMNDKAQKLHMTNSHFVTSNGLDDNTNNHYTTAYDLTKLAKAAYSNPWTKEVMNIKTSVVQFINGAPAKIDNRNKLLGIGGCVAGKTGYTSKSGRCLVAIYERNGRHLVGVVMNSKYNFPQDTIVFDDMKKLMDWSYNAREEILFPKNTVIKTVKVPYKVLPFIGPTKTMDVPLEIKEDVLYYNNDVKPLQTFNTNTINPWKFSSAKSLGTLNISQRDYKKTVNLYSKVSKSQIFKDNVLIYSVATLALLVILVLIILLISSLKRKRRNKSRFY